MMIKNTIDQMVASASTIILGKEFNIRLCLACVFAGGHILIEDLPGVGKTTLAHVLAKVLGLQYNRIQFTSDMLPADITGISIYDQESAKFLFHPGPVFSQIILADEINRATPKAQSALLEAMEEGQVSIEGETRKLPDPFFVIATQNPISQIGTFPLPESQLDRFLMRIEMGYPDSQAERTLLKGKQRKYLLQEIQPIIDNLQLLAYQKQVTKIFVADPIIDYLQRILEHTRHSGLLKTGLSPRAGLSILHAAQAWAMMHGQDKVYPEDLQTILPSVIGHRLEGDGEWRGFSSQQIIKQLIEAIEVPL